MRTKLLTLAAALLVAAAAPTVADAQTPAHLYAKLTADQQAAWVNVRADTIIAAKTRSREDRSLKRRNARALWSASVNREADDRARKLAFEALIRAYEGQSHGEGVSLNLISTAGQPLPPGYDPWAGELIEGPGLEYVRHVFRTAELPPTSAEREEMERWAADGVLRMAWCKAGEVLFGDVGGEVNRAYGLSLAEQRELTERVPAWKRPPPPPRKLSEDAARWWDRCWDGRFWEKQG